MDYAKLTPVSEWIGYGDIITVRGKDKLYRVTKVNPKNLKIEDQEGRSFTLDRRAAVRAPEGSVFEAPVRVVVPEVVLGSVVTFTGDMRFKAPGKYVCVGHLPDRRAKFALLNGDAGRFWKASLETVELSSAE